MRDILAFFTRHAAFMNENRISEACDSILLPTTIYLGDEILFVSEKSRLVDFMTSYTQKLAEAGLTKTSFEIIAQSPLRNDGVKVDVQWDSLDEAGVSHQTVHMTYYCRRYRDDWKIALVEVTTPLSDTFYAARKTNRI